MYTLTAPESYPNVIPDGPLSEEQLREFASNLNPQLAWKKAMQEKPIEDVISALEANAFEVDEGGE